MTHTLATAHVDYPHETGHLYDCPACEESCHCTGRPMETMCVACAIARESGWYADDYERLDEFA